MKNSLRKEFETIALSRMRSSPGSGRQAKNTPNLFRRRFLQKPLIRVPLISSGRVAVCLDDTLLKRKKGRRPPSPNNLKFLIHDCLRLGAVFGTMPWPRASRSSSPAQKRRGGNTFHPARAPISRHHLEHPSRHTFQNRLIRRLCIVDHDCWGMLGACMRLILASRLSSSILIVLFFIEDLSPINRPPSFRTRVN